MKLVILIGAIGLLLVGCATPPPNYSPRQQEISEPPLGVVSIASVGDYMVRQGKFVEHEALMVNYPISAGAYTIQPGIYLKTGVQPDVDLYYPGGASPGRVIQSALADNWIYVIIKKETPERICVLTSYNSAITTCSVSNGYSKVKVDANASDSFQQTLIYSGRVGGKVNVSYREFSSNLARPAFSNNVEYDLSESKTIQYKGAIIEIVEANNQSIKYRVIKNFNNAVQ